MSSQEKKYNSDQQWVREISRGSEAAFKALFFEFYPHLCSAALSIVGSRSRARDVVQDVFLKLWKRKAEWEVHTSLKVYLYQAVRNEALNHAQKEKSHRKLKQRFAESVSGSQEIVEVAQSAEQDPELVTLIWEIVEELPERRRFVFFLHRKHGLSYKEIAEVMDITRKTVENHMGAALSDIRERLKQTAE